MSEEEKIPEIEYVEVEMSEQDLKDRRRMLDSAKLNKDDTDIQLKELEAMLEKKIPSRMLQDTINELEGDIKNKKCRTKNKEGFESVRDATDADMDLMKIKLNTLKETLKADIPMRDLRFQISEMRMRKEHPTAPEQQIKKLEKEIRTKKITTLKNRERTNPMVG